MISRCEIEAYDMGQRTLADEIDDLERDEHLDDEIEAMKARLRDAPQGSAGAQQRYANGYAKQ